MKITVDSDEAMRHLGEQFGRALRGGECIELIGDIGSGKTTLTKGIAKGMGIIDTVQSPTFTINRTYEAPNGLFLSHYDFYRLSEAGIMSEELTESLTDEKTAIVIEWGDVVAPVLPEQTLKIVFESPTETSRVLSLQATGDKAAALVKAVA